MSARTQKSGTASTATNTDNVASIRARMAVAMVVPTGGYSSGGIPQVIEWRYDWEWLKPVVFLATMAYAIAGVILFWISFIIVDKLTPYDLWGKSLRRRTSRWL